MTISLTGVSTQSPLHQGYLLDHGVVVQHQGEGLLLPHLLYIVGHQVGWPVSVRDSHNGELIRGGDGGPRQVQHGVLVLLHPVPQQQPDLVPIPYLLQSKDLAIILNEQTTK